MPRRTWILGFFGIAAAAAAAIAIPAGGGAVNIQGRQTYTGYAVSSASATDPGTGYSSSGFTVAVTCTGTAQRGSNRTGTLNNNLWVKISQTTSGSSTGTASSGTTTISAKLSSAATTLSFGTYDVAQKFNSGTTIYCDKTTTLTFTPAMTGGGTQTITLTPSGTNADP